MDHNQESYSVFPNYCIGDNAPSDETPESLRRLLIEALNEAIDPQDDPVDPGTDLLDLLGMGDDMGDYVRFDVTLGGALQSTLAVYPGRVPRAVEICQPEEED